MSLPHHHESKGGEMEAPTSPAKVENRIAFPPRRSYETQYDDQDDADMSYDEEDDLDHPNQEMNRLLVNGNRNNSDSEKESVRHLDDLYESNNGNENGAFPDGEGPHHVDQTDESLTANGKWVWLFICFFGIMFSFVAYGLLLEYATSGGRKLHELSFLFVTSLLYTCAAAAGRNVRGEQVTTIPPARFAVLGMTSMGSTFCSVRSLR